MQDNLAKNLEKPCLVHVISPDAPSWELWLKDNDFTITDQESAEVILWGDPEEPDWNDIITDNRIIVIGGEAIVNRCQMLEVSYIEKTDDGEGILRQLREKSLETIEEQVVSKPVTSPPKAISLPKIQVPLKLKTPKKEVGTLEFKAGTQKDTVDIIVAFPKNTGHKLQKYIHEKGQEKGYRVLDVVDSLPSLLRVLEQGSYEIILIHRELPGLVENLWKNMKAIRSLSSARIITIERQIDHYTASYKDEVEEFSVEWNEISILPGCLMSILNKDDTVCEANLDWDLEWSVEEKSSQKNLPQTQVLRPAMIVTHSAGGGIGKSTTALQLGFEFAALGYKTMIIELDQEKPSIARGSGVNIECPGLVNWDIRSDFKNVETSVEAIRRTSRQVRGLYVLPVGPVAKQKAILPFYMATSNEDPLKMADTLFNAALREFQIVIVDTNPNFTDPAVFQALKRADKILYIMEGTKVFLDSAKIHLIEAEQHGVDTSNYRIIVNKCTGHDPLNKKNISQTLDMPIAAEIPLDVDGYRKAADKGVPYKPKKGISPWTEYTQQLLSELQVPIVSGKKKRSGFNLFGLWRKR